MGKYINGESVHSLDDCIYCQSHDFQKGICKIEICCCLKETAAALNRRRKEKAVVQKWAA